VDNKETKNKAKTQNKPRAKGSAQRGRPEREWANDAAKARTAGDPRARTPSDALGQPSDRSFDE
jgi:hypothetical protein